MTAQDIRSNKTREIMAKRFDYAKKIGCDGVDPDNTGAHEVTRRPVLHCAGIHELTAGSSTRVSACTSRQKCSWTAAPWPVCVTAVCSLIRAHQITM